MICPWPGTGTGTDTGFSTSGAPGTEISIANIESANVIATPFSIGPPVSFGNPSHFA
jgi:hypothetical protein